MRVSLGPTGDPVSIKIDASKCEEQNRGTNPDSQNPFAAVRPQQQSAKCKAGSHDPHPGNQDITDRKCGISREENSSGRVQEYPQPIKLSERSRMDRIEQIVRC